MDNKFWQFYERVYDMILLRLSPYQVMLEKAFLLLEPRKGLFYLDAGCGTGNFLRLLSASTDDYQLHGVDFSPAMLNRAKEKLGQNKTKVTLLETDLNKELPFANHLFDGIVCLNVIYAISEAEHLVNEFGRILEPGGRLVLSTPLKEPKITPIVREHLSLLKETYPKSWLFVFVGQVLKVLFPMSVFILINIFIKRKKEFTFYSEDEIKALLLSAGLKPETVLLVYGKQNWLIRAVCDSRGTAL
jgi:ubiquinone/menaquinone biosynthesis C-methylase UbiE